MTNPEVPTCTKENPCGKFKAWGVCSHPWGGDEDYEPEAKPEVPTPSTEAKEFFASKQWDLRVMPQTFDELCEIMEAYHAHKNLTENGITLTENERAFLVLVMTREIDDYESYGGNQGSYLAAKSLEPKLLALERNGKQ